MNLKKEENNVYEVYKVEGTDYYIEIYQNGNYLEFWLYKETYGIKIFMIGIEKTSDYLDIMKNNIADYIADYEEEYVEE